MKADERAHFFHLEIDTAANVRVAVQRNALHPIDAIAVTRIGGLAGRACHRKAVAALLDHGGSEAATDLDAPAALLERDSVVRQPRHQATLAKMHAAPLVVDFDF